MFRSEGRKRRSKPRWLNERRSDWLWRQRMQRRRKRSYSRRQ
jgi:hypothetical protein